MSRRTDELRGALYAIASGVLYGSLGYFGVQIIESGFSVLNMLLWRFLIATIAMALLVAIRVRAKTHGNYWGVFLSGALFYSNSAAFYFWATHYIGTGLAMVISFTYPVFVALFTWCFHRHKITRIYYISLAMIIIGLGLLVNPNEVDFDLAGILLALISALAYGVYIFVSKKQAHSYHPLQLTLIVCCSCTLVFFVLAGVEGSLALPKTPALWLNIFAISIVCTALPILFFLKSLEYIGATKAAILTVLEPVVTVIIGIAFLGESQSIYQLIGVVTTLVGALAIQFDKKAISQNKKM